MIQTSKPPTFFSADDESTMNIKNHTTAKDEDASDLKNDIALQRLLRESHLLDNTQQLAPTGKNRHKALDLRMQALGSTSSIYEQRNMPSSHRIGIKAKAAAREEKRRREARENGIILERPKPTSSTRGGKGRDRGIGRPSVGKFAGGTLNLSRKNISAIHQAGPAGKGKTRRRR